jgi:hypothetical protein
VPILLFLNIRIPLAAFIEQCVVSTALPELDRSNYSMEAIPVWHPKARKSLSPPAQAGQAAWPRGARITCASREDGVARADAALQQKIGSSQESCCRHKRSLQSGPARARFAARAPWRVQFCVVCHNGKILVDGNLCLLYI